MERYTVDGTDEDGFTLSGDGQRAPFAVFDVEKQDWLPSFHETSEAAKERADALNHA